MNGRIMIPILPTRWKFLEFAMIHPHSNPILRKNGIYPILIATNPLYNVLFVLTIPFYKNFCKKTATFSHFCLQKQYRQNIFYDKVIRTPCQTSCKRILWHLIHQTIHSFFAFFYDFKSVCLIQILF